MNRQQRRQAERKGEAQPQPQTKAIATMTLHLMPNNQVAISVPRDVEHIFKMLSGLFNAMSSKLTLKEESPIVTPPPGFKP